MDTTELERLRKLYPLFRFEQQDDYIRAYDSESSSLTLKLEGSGVDSKTILYLDHRHSEKHLSTALMTVYPDLYISVCVHKDGAFATAWVKRDNRDAEAIGSVDIESPDLHETLSEWQREAEQAKKEGYFMCSGHQRAEPIEEFDFFYFAGKYCKKYGKEHPQLRKAAMAETYE